jgi:transketolase
MRKEFATTIIDLARSREDLVLLSGDLGYMAFEQVRDVMGDRFINTGVAEQNTISVAAGLAARGFSPIVYSIAPFIALRPFEQIRNDICFHNLPVTLVGNGGGYGYGIMGSSHHALEDVGIMRAIPNMRVYTPVFASDVAKCLCAALDRRGPAYIRLGASVENFGEVAAGSCWAAFRRILRGSKVVIVAMGPIVGNIISVLQHLPPDSVELWTAGEFPILEIDDAFKSAVRRIGKLITVEEHYRSAGMSENIAQHLVGIPNLEMMSLCAKGYPSGRYGSQKWHQEESGLSGDGILKAVLEILA